MVDRISVFLDYENVHRGGHGQYERWGTPTYSTVVDPLKIAQQIVAKRRFPSELAGVFAYRGRPLPQYEPKARQSNDLLADAWERDGVTVARRDLKYVDQPDGSFAVQEKGIDVALAIGVVSHAAASLSDVVVVFSNDTDQRPTLEYVYRQTPTRLEIATWSGAKPLWFPEELAAGRKMPYCHFLTEQDFRAARDYRGLP